MSESKQIYWSDAARGQAMWERHFAGRPGVAKTVVERESGAASEGQAVGLYLDLPAALADAWDVSLRAAKASRDGSGRARIESALDAIAPRSELLAEVAP